MELLTQLPPGLPLILLSGFALLIPKSSLRPTYLAVLTLLSWTHMQWAVPVGTLVEVESMGLELTPIRADRITWVWGTVFHLAAFLSVVYAWHMRLAATTVMGLVYAGASIAAVFAGDLLTLFTYWELTAVSSVFLVWWGGDEGSRSAGMRYLLVQVVSGVSLLSAAILWLQQNGELSFGGINEVGVMLEQVGTPAGVMMVIALAVKAAFPLVHGWLPDSYPKASPAGTVFLSAFTTKLAIYVMLRALAGWEPLIAIGCTMAILPLVYAVLVDDWRMKLSYCLNNQLGFMVVAVGVGSELAVNGAAAHAVAHILYKGLLFMAAGAVLYRMGTARCSELGGLMRDMPLVFAAHLIGVAAISLPLFSGFVTKSLSISATAEAHYERAWLCLLVATAGVFLVCGLQITHEVFLGAKQSSSFKGEQRPVPRGMLIAMTLASLFCLLIGLFPVVLYRWLPFETAYRPYTVPHVVGQLQLMTGAALVYGIARAMKLLPAKPGVYLDVDWFYRRPLAQITSAICRAALEANERFKELATRMWKRAFQELDRALADDGRSGVFRSTGQMAMWAAVMLVVYLICYYR